MDVQNTWQVIETSFLHYERKEMDESPLEMMIHPKSLEKAQSELGTRMKRKKNVLLVEDMKYNLLRVSQMCDQGHKVTFDSQKCEIRKEGSGKLVTTAARTSSNIYVLSEIGNEKCCLGKEDESWLWHRRMGHMHFDNLVKVSKREAVREMPQHETNQHFMQALPTRKANKD
jgi:hypothetical protein